MGYQRFNPGCPCCDTSCVAACDAVLPPALTFAMGSFEFTSWHPTLIAAQTVLYRDGETVNYLGTVDYWTGYKTKKTLTIRTYCKEHSYWMSIDDGTTLSEMPLVLGDGPNPGAFNPRCGNAYICQPYVAAIPFDFAYDGWRIVLLDYGYHEDGLGNPTSSFGYQVSVPLMYATTGFAAFIDPNLNFNAYQFFDTWPRTRPGIVLLEETPGVYTSYEVLGNSIGIDPGTGSLGLQLSVLNIILEAGVLTFRTYGVWESGVQTADSAWVKYAVADSNPLAVSRYVFLSSGRFSNNTLFGQSQAVGSGVAAPFPDPNDHELYVTARYVIRCGEFGDGSRPTDPTCEPCHGGVLGELNVTVAANGPGPGPGPSLGTDGSTGTIIWNNPLAVNRPTVNTFGSLPGWYGRIGSPAFMELMLRCTSADGYTLAVGTMGFPGTAFTHGPGYSLTWSCTPSFILVSGPWLDASGNQYTFHISE